MTKTLHKYIGMELARVTGLALVAFTLVLTVFAIIEPLRKEGLSGSQVLTLFVFTLPMMMSLTLPIAALFAASIIYGRFSQDNELLASRASGISTLTLLTPAIALGIIVTVASWVLNNNVTPVMAKRASTAVKTNVRGIAYRKLAARNYISADYRIIHADRVVKDRDMVQGVVVIDRSKGDKNVTLFAAQVAWARFDTDEQTGETYATFNFLNPVLTESNSPNIRHEYTGPIDSVRIPGAMREKPSWYSWDELRATLDDPIRSGLIRRSLTKIQRSVFHNIFSRHVADVMRENGKYDQLRRGNERYVIQAGRVRAAGSGTVVLRNLGRHKTRRPVIVTVLRDGRPVQSVTADAGKIYAKWSPSAQASQVSIVLNKDVVVHDPQNPERKGQTRREWARGQIRLPKAVRQAIKGITLQQVYSNVKELTDSPGINRELEKLKNLEVVTQNNNIIAEIHGRIAYSTSCVLLVSLGAAMGLMFRGGQIISAFATSIVPAAAVIVMIIMGKKMVENPDAPVFPGLVAIWSGLVVLAVVTACVFAYLARK